MENLGEVIKNFYKVSLLKALILAVLIFVIALSAGYWFGRARTLSWTRQVINSIHPVRENNLNYKFIYPLLGYDFAEAKQFLENHSLEAEINSYIQSQYKAKDAQSISVYFRNFTDATWAGVNQNAQYHPGSMLKVIIMMGYYREAELDPTILQKILVYDKDTDQQAAVLQFAMPTKLTVGQSYTVEQLIRDMIADSDNGAETLLINNVDRKILNDAYADLNINNPDSFVGDYTISAEQYAGFLRILYNSTYLSEKYWEEAGSILSQSTYKDGISAGLPDGVVAAQKYGERVSAQNNVIQTIELHDCGVVYAKSPYAICIMTKGDDVTKLTSAIKNISGIVYGYVSSH